MAWTLLLTLVGALSLAIIAIRHRRAQLGDLADRLDERQEARRRGTDKARLQYPHVDLSRCLGCATCIRACPEEGVLDLIHGQAIVVHGARCVGHGRCADECPTGAIVVTLGDLGERRDIPVLDEQFEVPESPGLFLAGEVTGYALIRTAIAHGTAIADQVAQRVADVPEAERDEAWDLCVVGAGPAGLACSLEAKSRGLRFVTLEQEGVGGTVAKYPRRKLVMTQPVELPLFGKLEKTSYAKEELMEIWEKITELHELPIHTGVRFTGVERMPDGMHRVKTVNGDVIARNVCLALGRRGTPRKLGVPGEELPKVAYSLIDAQSFRGRRVVVVGGGDSAVEAALGLAEQPGNEVTLSYRREGFFRLKARNEARLEQATHQGELRVATGTQVVAVTPEHVELSFPGDEGRPNELLPNDEVFVMAGGIPPFQLLEEGGVSFDPSRRADAEPLVEQGTGLLRALVASLVLAFGALAWVLVFHDYYLLDLGARATSRMHDVLRPSRGIGLGMGVAATVLIVANLAYLLRRSARVPLWFGSLRKWMTSHVVTGILAFLLALLHSGMQPGSTIGGHAFQALAALLVTGAVGRYFYAFVPHAANGRELALEDVRSELAELFSRFDQEHRQFGERVQKELAVLVEAGGWRSSFLRRLWSLIRSQSRLRGTFARLRREGRAEGLAEEQLAPILALARRAQRIALMAAHYEELRALLASWRYVHRWAAVLMVLLVVAHIATALRFGNILG